MKNLICALALSATMVMPSAAQDPLPVPPSTPTPAPPAEPPVAPAPSQPGEQPVTPAKEPLPKITQAQPAGPVPEKALDPEMLRARRREIRNMEGVLASAVRGAAQEIASEIQTPETGPFLLSGSLTARGFILEDYGVFFHVEIPGVAPSLLSSSVLRQLQERFGRSQQPPAQAQPTSSGGATAAAPADPQPANPDAVYVERVKNALMRAMIQYSKPLALRPDEWLTVAAGDGDEPLMPAVLSEKAIMVLRIRGRDIAEYLAERLSLDEVLKRVEVRKF